MACMNLEYMTGHNWRYIGQAWHSDIGAIRRKRKYKLSYEGDSTCFCVKELTEDHHPDRNDERSRVEAAGGHVVDWGGVSRVNGKLAVSRAIGDVSFKRYRYLLFMRLWFKEELHSKGFIEVGLAF